MSATTAAASTAAACTAARPAKIVSNGYHLVGRRISVRWKGRDGKPEFYEGEVRGYSSVTGKHHVQYDDGDERDYTLAQKCWKLLGAGAEAGALLSTGAQADLLDETKPSRPKRGYNNTENSASTANFGSAKRARRAVSTPDPVPTSEDDCGEDAKDLGEDEDPVDNAMDNSSCSDNESDGDSDNDESSSESDDSDDENGHDSGSGEGQVPEGEVVEDKLAPASDDAATAERKQLSWANLHSSMQAHHDAVLAQASRAAAESASSLQALEQKHNARVSTLEGMLKATRAALEDKEQTARDAQTAAHRAEASCLAEAKKVQDREARISALEVKLRSANVERDGLKGTLLQKDAHIKRTSAELTKARGAAQGHEARARALLAEAKRWKLDSATSKAQASEAQAKLLELQHSLDSKMRGARADASAHSKAKMCEMENTLHKLRTQQSEQAQEMNYQRKETQAKVIQLKQAAVEIERLREELAAQKERSTDLALQVDNERHDGAALREALEKRNEELRKEQELSNTGLLSRIFK